ncbi:MAG TPA: hypothetical protein VHU44_09510 [Acidobacteriaceae bacterium]|jgi:hypothetical protein|nr:hypothetical protein [Acidobacteriaceae bacterium]
MATPTFPFVEVLSYETGLPVKVVAWHVRSVRPIREMVDDNENVTRIEFTNGDALDTTDSVPDVVERLSGALRPASEWAAARRPRNTTEARKRRG